MYTHSFMHTHCRRASTAPHTGSIPQLNKGYICIYVMHMHARVHSLQEGFDSTPYGFDPTFQRFSAVYNGKVTASRSCVCMYACMHVCAHSSRDLLISLSAVISVCIDMQSFTYVHICMNTHIHTCIHLYTYTPYSKIPARFTSTKSAQTTKT